MVLLGLLVEEVEEESQRADSWARLGPREPQALWAPFQPVAERALRQEVSRPLELGLARVPVLASAQQTEAPLPEEEEQEPVPLPS